MDTQNYGLEKVTPFKYGHFSIYMLNFMGCNFRIHICLLGLSSHADDAEYFYLFSFTLMIWGGRAIVTTRVFCQQHPQDCNHLKVVVSNIFYVHPKLWGRFPV